MLVLLIFVSLIQDVVWFVWNRDIDDDEDDGGLEKTVKSFSRTMSFVSFIWRVSSTLCSLFITRLQHRRCRRTFYQQFAGGQLLSGAGLAASSAVFAPYLA